MKTLLVLGHSPFLTSAYRWAQEAGLEIVQTGGEGRPRGRSTHEFHRIPLDASEAHVALARRLARERRLAGVLAVEPATEAILAPLSDALPGLLPPRATLELLASPERSRTWLHESGFASSPGAPAPEGARLEVFAFFRDGAFVPGGVARRETLASGDELRLWPGAESAQSERAAYVLVERAARMLGFQRGPLQATLVQTPRRLELATLSAGYRDLLGAVECAALSYGRSPLQAWFAHLAGAGGPFDALALEGQAWSAWLGVAPARAGLFAGIDGESRARAVPGIAGLWSEGPGRKLESPELPQAPLAFVWAEGTDRDELRERLGAARALLEVRVATRQRVA